MTVLASLVYMEHAEPEVTGEIWEPRVCTCARVTRAVHVLVAMVQRS